MIEARSNEWGKRGRGEGEGASGVVERIDAPVDALGTDESVVSLLTGRCRERTHLAIDRSLLASAGRAA